MATEKIINATVEGNDIVIRCPIDGLVFIVENDPEYKYKVVNKEKFAKEMVFELNESKSFTNHSGRNGIEELFQNAYEKVSEQGDDEIMTSDYDFNQF